MSFWDVFFLLLIYVPLMLIWGASIVDIFRRDDIGGGRKALWLATVIVLPLLGTLIYLIARPAGATKSEREVLDLASREFVARYSPDGEVQRLQVLADLHDRGKLTDEEFASEKARLVQPAPA
jgi:hypothetical protein